MRPSLGEHSHAAQRGGLSGLLRPTGVTRQQESGVALLPKELVKWLTRSRCGWTQDQ